MCIKAMPKYTGPEVTAIVLTMSPSSAIPHKTAVAEDGRAKAVVSATHPHQVEHVSELFTRIYGMRELQIVGRTYCDEDVFRAGLAYETEVGGWYRSPAARPAL